MKTGAIVVAGVALVLCACGSKEEQAGAASGATASAPQAGQGRASDNAVAAILESQGTPVAGLRFEVVARPVAGQPFTVKLLASAPQPVPALRLSVDAEGLTVVPATGVMELAAADTTVEHELTVTAAQAGLTDLHVRLAAGEGGVETLYAIPLLVTEAQ